MSCRLTIRRGEEAHRPGALERTSPYYDLVRAGREEDFRWLALSQGIPADRVGDLWRRWRALVARH